MRRHQLGRLLGIRLHAIDPKSAEVTCRDGTTKLGLFTGVAIEVAPTTGLIITEVIAALRPCVDLSRTRLRVAEAASAKIAAFVYYKFLPR